MDNNTQLNDAHAPVRLQEGHNGSLTVFKQGVDDLLAKRQYFIKQVLPLLKEGLDFFVIKGKKSLGKAGAEKLASIWSIKAKFEKDHESIEMLGATPGLVAYRCDLYRDEVFQGQGRGSDALERNQNDANKTIKMAQKRAYVDAIIRSTGLSDIFTQDLEDSNGFSCTDSSESSSEAIEEQSEDAPVLSEVDDESSKDNLATMKQRNFLRSLLIKRCGGENGQFQSLYSSMTSLTKAEASRLISGLLMGRLPT